MAIQHPTGVESMKLTSQASSELGCLRAHVCISRPGAGRAQARSPWHRSLAHGHVGETGRRTSTHYANGTWLKSYEIPPDRAAVGVFSILDDVANKRTAALIEEIAKSTPNRARVLARSPTCFNTFMDEPGIEAKGMAPLRPISRPSPPSRTKKELGARVG